MRHCGESKHYLDALRKREKHLAERLKGLPKQEGSFDRQEKAALGWAIVNLDSLDAMRSELAHRQSKIDALIRGETACVPDNRQHAVRVERNTFKVPAPHTGKPVDVVYASFAACLEREANSLREKLKPSNGAGNSASAAGAKSGEPKANVS